MQLPSYEKRPGFGYEFGHAVSQGCLTGSMVLNVLRLASVAFLVPQCVLLASGTGSLSTLVVSAVLFAATFLIRVPIKRPMLRTTLGRGEQHIAAVIGSIVQQGVSVTDAVQATVAEPLVIDYGMTTEQEIVCVAQHLRQAHQVIIGASGTGKSKFIAMQAEQALVCGASLVVIDPHEELAQDIIRAAAPIIREKGMVVLWPDAQQHIYPWNPLYTSDIRTPWQASDSVVGAVKRVWQLTEANTYILDVVRHTSWALAGAGWTLLEAPRFLTDERFRTYVTERAAIPEVTTWVTQYNLLKQRERVQLIQTAFVRLTRLQGNPHLRLMVGAGVRDSKYRAAYREEGGRPANGRDLGRVINSGQHVFAVLPDRLLGEDQYLVAGLVQSALLEAIFRRTPHHPANPMTEAYLDEVGAYANREGLGKILAQARKFNFSATVALQGMHQAEEGLRDELLTNTMIKAVFGTGHPEEAMHAASSLYSYDPLLVKVDARQRVGDRDNRREVGAFQTYPPQEQQSFYASRISHLPFRHYLLKVRGFGSPVEVITPEHVTHYSMEEGLRIANSIHHPPLIDAKALQAELAWRWQWLEAGKFGHKPRPAVRLVPAESMEVSAQEPHLITFQADESSVPDEKREVIADDAGSIVDSDGATYQPNNGDDTPMTFGGEDDF